MLLTTHASQVEVDVLGTGDETVVFLPAVGATKEMWKAQTAEFARRYQVLTYHECGPLRGRPERTFAELSSQLLQILDSCAVEHAHLVGLSMGGMVAQVFAARYGSRVRRLVLACTTARQSAMGLRRMESCAEIAGRKGMEPLVEPTVQRWFTPEFIDRRPGVVDWVRTMIRGVDPVVYSSLAGAVAHVDTMAELADIRVPTLVLSAANDVAIDREAAALLRAHITDSQGVILSDAGHMCNVEQSVGFNEEVLAFLAVTH